MNSLSSNSWISNSLGSITGFLLVCFDGAMFAWFFVICVTSGWCLCIWNSKFLFISLTGKDFLLLSPWTHEIAFRIAMKCGWGQVTYLLSALQLDTWLVGLLPGQQMSVVPGSQWTRLFLGSQSNSARALSWGHFWVHSWVHRWWTCY